MIRNVMTGLALASTLVIGGTAFAASPNATPAMPATPATTSPAQAATPATPATPSPKAHAVSQHHHAKAKAKADPESRAAAK